MNIADYLSRLSTLKDNLKESLESKGIIIPDNPNLSNLIPLVDNVKAQADAIQKIRYSFGVLSDVHLCDEKYQSDDANTQQKYVNALNFYNRNNVDFICVDGDLVWNGSGNRSQTTGPEEESISEWIDELTLYKTLTDNNWNKPIYTVTGNHDATVYGYSSAPGGLFKEITYNDNTVRAYEVWRDIIGTEPNFVVEHDGDIFIFLSMYHWNYINPFEDEHTEWLKTKLETYKNKRVFLFFHVMLNNTFSINVDEGSGLSSDKTTGVVSRLRPLLLSYPNVIWFSGHSHFDMANEGDLRWENPNTYQADNSMTMIHVPSCAYIRAISTDGTISRDFNSSQGLLVDVYDDRIVIKSINFMNNGGTIIETANYVINTKY